MGRQYHGVKGDETAVGHVRGHMCSMLVAALVEVEVEDVVVAFLVMR